MEKSEIYALLNAAEGWFACLKHIELCVNDDAWDNLEAFITAREEAVTAYMDMAQHLDLTTLTPSESLALQKILTDVHALESMLMDHIQRYQSDLSQSFNSLKMEAVLKEKYAVE